jgi:hypothetical protein
MKSPSHPFLDLPLTDRAAWVSAFAARKVATPLVGPPFPSLITGQTPSDWLIDHFQRLSLSPGARDRMRETVVSLIGEHGGPSPVDRDQVVGAMLAVASHLNFREILVHLASWVRSGWLDEKHIYKVGSMNLSLRRTVWSLLIGWDYLDALGPQLVRDLVRLAESGESGTSQMCFVALGQRDPGTALEMIPQAAKWWHATLWTSAVLHFFNTVGADTLLREKYKSSWVRCLGSCFYDEQLQRYLRPLYSSQFAEFDPRRSNRMYDVLEAIGIKARPGSIEIVLERGFDRLVLDVSLYTDPTTKSAHFPLKRTPVPEGVFA